MQGGYCDMKICIINGSPKTGKSISELLIGYFMPLMEQNDMIAYNISKKELSETQLAQIQDCEAIIFAFSLYIDSIHSQLLRFLIGLEKRGFGNKSIHVYCIINNGFYEGRQNHIAADIIKNWCKATGLNYGQTVGIGAGEMLPFIKDIPLGYGPNKNLGIALRELSCNVLSLNQGEDIFISPNWPRFLWRIMSSLYCWYPRAKKNGLTGKRLKDKVT